MVHARQHDLRLVGHQARVLLEEDRLGEVVGLLRELPLGFARDVVHVEPERQQLCQP